MLFTKDVSPSEEQVREEVLAVGLPEPSGIVASGMEINIEFSVALTAEQIKALRDAMVRLGYFLNK